MTRTRIMFLAVWVAATIAIGRTGRAAPPDLGEFTARSITRLALLDARLARNPTTADYRIAYILLGMAQELAPGDQEILRRRVEAAWQGGDTDAVVDLTRALVKLDPHDTVSLLRLITARIARHQTAEERLALYDRFLDPKADGRHLDASVRSRLALDAALLLRDRGDEAAFIERLILATQLDSTHKEAALVALSYATDRVGVLDRLDLMANVLIADPVDPNVHEAIARQLTIGGAYRGAARFIENARVIRRASGQPVDGVDHAARILRWHSDGPSTIVQDLQHAVLLQKEEAAREIRDLEAKGFPVDGARRPESIRMSPDFATIVAVALDAAGDRSAVDAAVSDLSLTVNAVVTPLLNASLRPPEVSEVQALQQASAALASLQLARLWTGTQTDAAALAFEPGSPLVQTPPAELPILSAWLQLRQGQAAEAAQALEPLAESSILARVALAQACEQLGDAPRALEEYDRIVRDAPLELAGAWARSRMAALGVTLDPDHTGRLERWARAERAGGVPDWVDQAARTPRAFISLEADLDAGFQDAVDRTVMRLRVTNQRDIPMALGPDRTISSRLLLAPRLDAPLGVLAALARPEIVDIDRRLRLMPRETLEVDVWPDPGETGLLLEMMSLRSIRVRWRVIQGFWLGAAGGYEPGPMCLTTESPPLYRNALPEASLGPQELARKVEADPESLLPRAASALRTLLLMAGPDGANGAAPNEQAINMVVTGWTTRWPSLSPLARAMAAAVIPGRAFGAPLGTLDDLLKADTDPIVLAVVLVTRVTDPGDEFLARMERSPDPRVAELARLVGDRLKTGGDSYAHLSPAKLWPDAPAPAP